MPRFNKIASQEPLEGSGMLNSSIFETMRSSLRAICSEKAELEKVATNSSSRDSSILTSNLILTSTVEDTCFMVMT